MLGLASLSDHGLGECGQGQATIKPSEPGVVRSTSALRIWEGTKLESTLQRWHWPWIGQVSLDLSPFCRQVRRHPLGVKARLVSAKPGF